MKTYYNLVVWNSGQTLLSYKYFEFRAQIEEQRYAALFLGRTCDQGRYKVHFSPKNIHQIENKKGLGWAIPPLISKGVLMSKTIELALEIRQWHVVNMQNLTSAIFCLWVQAFLLPNAFHTKILYIWYFYITSQVERATNLMRSVIKSLRFLAP